MVVLELMVLAREGMEDVQELPALALGMEHAEDVQELTVLALGKELAVDVQELMVLAFDRVEDVQELMVLAYDKEEGVEGPAEHRPATSENRAVAPASRRATICSMARAPSVPAYFACSEEHGMVPSSA